MKENVVREKSFVFALRVVKLARCLQAEKKEFVLSRQVLRSGTAVGALVREAEHAQSKADFINKMSIALKEANETVYWLELLYKSEYIPGHNIDAIQFDCKELVKLLAAIVKTSKKSINDN
jgi:four helix bundle protein